MLICSGGPLVVANELFLFVKVLLPSSAQTQLSCAEVSGNTNQLFHQIYLKVAVWLGESFSFLTQLQLR